MATAWFVTVRASRRSQAMSTGWDCTAAQQHWSLPAEAVPASISSSMLGGVEVLRTTDLIHKASYRQHWHNNNGEVKNTVTTRTICEGLNNQGHTSDTSDGKMSLSTLRTNMYNDDQRETMLATE